MEIAKTPLPPYYAVIFTSIGTEANQGYAEISLQIIDSVQRQPGFLGFESARDNLGITISYWESLDAIKNWKCQAEH